MDDEGLRVADVGNHRQELHAVRESPAGLVPALDDEGEQAARAQRRVLLAQLVVGGGLQARVVDGLDVRVCLQEVGDRQRVGDVALDAQRQGLDALRNEERVEGGGDCPQVAVDERLDAQQERQVRAQRAAHAQVAGVDEAVVGLVRRVVEGEALGLGGKVEVARVDDRARDRGSVTAQVLGGRVDDDVGAPLDRAHQVGGGDRVVDDEGHADLVGDRCDGLDVEDVALRVGDRLAVEGDRLVVGERAPGLGVERVRDEARLDAQASQRVLQQGDAAAVQGGGGDHVVAGHGQGKDRQGGRGLAGGDEEAADAALQGGDAGGDAVGRRVGQARVDGAQLLQREAARGLRSVLEGVGGGLVDGQGGRAGGGIKVVSGVNLLGFEGPVVGGHCAAPGVGGGSSLIPLRRAADAVK